MSTIQFPDIFKFQVASIEDRSGMDVHYCSLSLLESKRRAFGSFAQ